ncbi:MAG: ATP phosphoribosyltransferase [Alphaproteobacteria bacterium]|nr:ATP phosphoribosyltransferase [Hyphomonas sp.]MBR9806227.1 ATP phosphoribosyltransferase [Alphaproteobacteria bacterium]|tara:strand:+ start:945 stop:1655 length:711 start_codon:yes stop_codon:yes gene_type:complete
MSILSLAIPSKGRLKEKTEDWFREQGFPIRQIGGERGYQAEIDGLGEVDMRLLSAREIAQGLIDGTIHAGVTGEDLLQDLSPTGDAEFRVAERLGFGGADVIVAVPQAWLDVDTMSDLEAAGAAFRKAHHRRLRVATKYMRLTRRFFAAKSVGEYRLAESAGATEAAPATGAADVIVDITSTGATLKANGLKVLSDGVILKSQAVLAVSTGAEWTPQALNSLSLLRSAAKILDQIC